MVTIMAADEEPSSGAENDSIRDESSGDSAPESQQGNGDESSSEVGEEEDYLTDPLRRREIASDGSEYSPSDESSSAAASGEDDEGASPSVQETHPSVKASVSQRKRPARPSLDFDLEHRPLKRLKGTFSHDYLALLNTDIEDAAVRYVTHDGPKLPESQIGLSVWTPVEKDLFFEALSRLGRGDISGIARRIRTKGELEILQYLKLLEDALEIRKAEGDLDHMHTADFPAAAKFSVKCCYALDESADAIAIRQEKHEDLQEQLRWGDHHVIAPENYRDLEDAAPEMRLPSVRFFKVENWLKLSERFFMNAPFEENNWQSVGELPSIRATTLEDFYSLAVSITRRLMAAARYISMSRIRSKKAAMPWTRNLVRSKDVEAAAASLGLSHDKRQFWIDCPRRLKLNVYKNPPKLGEDGEGEEQELMDYGDVEKALAVGLNGFKPPSHNPPIDLESSLSYDDEVDELLSSESTSQIDPGDEINTEEPTAPSFELDNKAETSAARGAEARRDAVEVTHYSALGFPETTGARRRLLARIQAAQSEDEFAAVVDAQASYHEEKRMWTILGRHPPEELEKVDGMARPVARGTIEELHPVGKDWKNSVRYVEEWEVEWLAAERGGLGAGPQVADATDSSRKREGEKQQEVNEGILRVPRP